MVHWNDFISIRIYVYFTNTLKFCTHAQNGLFWYSNCTAFLSLVRCPFYLLLDMMLLYVRLQYHDHYYAMNIQFYHQCSDYLPLGSCVFLSQSVPAVPLRFDSLISAETEHTRNFGQITYLLKCQFISNVYQFFWGFDRKMC